MGRYYWDKKDTVEDCTQLSIFKLKEFGLLNGYHATTLTWTRKLSGKQSSIGIVVDTEDELYVKVNYTITDRSTDEKTDYDYKIQLTTTPCHFGSVRYWFICPLSLNGVYCGRRVAKLYKAPGAVYYGCWHCYDLSYESRNKSHSGWIGQVGYVLTLERQVDKLRSRIKRDFYDGRPTKKFRRLIMMQHRLNAHLRSPAVTKFLRS